MTKDILDALKRRLPELSKSQRALANYILEFYEKAAFMTATRLATVVGVSESTVVRFAIEMGFNGYPELQKALQEAIPGRLTAVQRMEVTHDRLADQDVVSLVLQSDMEKLRRTIESVDRRDFEAAVSVILRAKRIFVIGLRSAAALAGFLGYYLNYMFENVHLITASGTVELLERVAGIGERDAVVAISFPRYSAATQTGVSYCKDAGASVIAITDSERSPVGVEADFVLTAKSDMVSLVDSLVAPLSLINALIVALAAKREKELTKTFGSLEKIWEKYQVYGNQNEEL